MMVMVVFFIGQLIHKVNKNGAFSEYNQLPNINNNNNNNNSNLKKSVFERKFPSVSNR